VAGNRALDLGYGEKFLDRLEGWDRLHLILSGQAKSFDPGDVLLGPSHHSQTIMLLSSGMVEVTTYAESARQAFLRVCFPGEFLGEEALLDLRRPRPARAFTAVALTPVDARVMSAAQMRSFLEAHPQAWVTLAQDLWARLSGADSQTAHLSEPTDRRLARLLWDLDRHGGFVQSDGGRRLPINISQNKLALWIGASRESVERALRKWRERGIVRTAPRTIVVYRPSALAAIAGVSRSTA